MEKMMKYYWLNPKHYKDEAIACAPEGLPLAHRMIDQVKDLNELPFSLILHDTKITNKLRILGVSNAEPIDYVANSLAWPVMSKRMKEIIETRLNGNEGVRWISVNVANASATFQYYIPVFTKFLDTLDKEHTEYCTPEPSPWIIKPYYRASEARKYGMFHSCDTFWQITAEIYLRSDIMKALKKEGITGVVFSWEARLV